MSGALVLGLRLRLTSTADGGRSTPLRGGADADARLTYRPNWGLPWMAAGEQTGAPVLGFSARDVHPGDEVRVAVVPLFPQMDAEWARVEVGDVLRMYEGSRVCGHGTVLWVLGTTRPLPEVDEWRVRAWLLDPGAPDALT